MNLPDSLQRRAIDELKMYATSPSPFDFDELPERAALNLAECHLISFGTEYNSAEALRWLKVAKSYRNAPSFCLRRISEALGAPPEVSQRHENQLEAIPETIQIENCDNSELYLTRRSQSRISSAISQIRALSPEGQPWFNVNHFEIQAGGLLSVKIGRDLLICADLRTVDIAALLGEVETMTGLLPTAEAFKGHEDQGDALHCSCIGGNLSTLKFLLDYGMDSSLCRANDITALHLLIYMPTHLVDRAVSLLVGHGAPTDTCSQKTSFVRLGLDLVGTPVEWAVIARNRGLVAALLPHSKGQERTILRHAISHAYYEIAEDLLSNRALSRLFTQEDCPILVFSQAFAHLICHGRNSDLAVERTIRLCDAHQLIHYETMLRRCIMYARTRPCLKALEILLDLCPRSVVRQGFESDEFDEVATSVLYEALGHAKSNTAWRPVLEAVLRNFSVAELDEVRQLKRSGSTDTFSKVNVLHTAVVTGWAIAVRVLLDKGVDVHRKTNMHTPISSIEIAAWLWDDEMHAILCEYGAGPLGSIMTDDHPILWLYLQKRMRRRGFNGFHHNTLGDRNASKLFVVSKAHEVLCQLLLSRDVYHSQSPAHVQFTRYKTMLWDEFRALISDEPMAGSIDRPDEDDVTMLQRATTYLDIDVIRLLLEAGADANVPFLATRRVGDDGNDLVVPFLPFRIACWVARAEASLFERGIIQTQNQSDTIATQQTKLEPTRKPHVLRHIAHIISHAAGTGVKRIRGSQSGPASKSGARVAESLRTSSLNVAQEFLHWHLLRNDRRFEGITEYHLCTYIGYVSRAVMLVRQKVGVADAKASWPGTEGKYTGLELARLSWKDECTAFQFNIPRLRGILKWLASDLGRLALAQQYENDSGVKPSRSGCPLSTRVECNLTGALGAGMSRTLQKG